MASSRTLDRAVKAINEHGVLLVYPLQNRQDPLSLWHVLYPKSEMRWAWDQDADPRVASLWHLREELSRSRRVAYAKWLLGRATFFSLDVFRAMVATLRAEGSLGPDLRRGLSPSSRGLLELLLDNSPQATKALRQGADLEGRAHEAEYNRAMKALWDRLLAVGCGEEEEGGFPSLAVAATELLFEDLWLDAETPNPGDARRLQQIAESSPAFARAWRKVTRGPKAPATL